MDIDNLSNSEILELYIENIEMMKDGKRVIRVGLCGLDCLAIEIEE